MPAQRFPRLEDLLGVQLDALTEQHLLAVVARTSTEPVREDTDIDFKQGLYGGRDEDKRDLAADVSALANTRGGLILLGVSETDAAATGLNPVAFSDDEERRMRQIVADTVFPRCEFLIKRIPSAANAANGTYLLAVAKSPVAPHGVRIGVGFRYYRRDGAQNRALSETEIADAYRNRFEVARSQVDRLQQVHVQGIKRRPQSANWISVALVPTVPGTMTIRAGTLTAMRRWLQPYVGVSIGDGPFGRQTYLQLTTGLRCILVTCDLGADGEPNDTYAELHTDGSGFVARPIWGRDEQFVALDDEYVVLSLVGMLKLLADHAVNTGSNADALLQASIGGGDSHGKPFKLGHRRQFDIWNNYAGARSLPQIPPSLHTVDVEAVAINNLDRALAVRMVVSDWLHAFGRPELLQISETGAIRTRYWNPNTLRGWKGRVGLEEDHQELPHEA